MGHTFPQTAFGLDALKVFVYEQLINIDSGANLNAEDCFGAFRWQPFCAIAGMESRVPCRKDGKPLPRACGLRVLLAPLGTSSLVASSPSKPPPQFTRLGHGCASNVGAWARAS